MLGWENRKNMQRTLDPAQFVLIALAGWMNQHQTIEYLREKIGFYGRSSGIVDCASMMTSARLSSQVT